MIDFVRFVLRGALGALIGPTLVLTWCCGLEWLFFFFYTVIIPALFVGVGALLGVILWARHLVVERLGPIQRMAIGSAVFGLALLIHSILLPSDTETPPFLEMLYWCLIFGVLYGAPTGLLCPGKTWLKKEPELKYRERAELYEAAEVEASRTRQKRVLGDIFWRNRSSRNEGQCGL